MKRFNLEHASLLPPRAMARPVSPPSRGGWLAGGAAALAAMALYVQYRSRKTEEDNPPTGQFIEVDGVRLHYQDRGQGRPIVLLHGNGTMAGELELSGLPQLAAQRYRVIAFDRPGYGYSERPRDRAWGPTEQARLLRQAMQELGIEQPLVVGHSWGAMVAIALALEYPDYVRALLLLSGYYYPTPRLDVALFSPPALPVIGDLLRYTAAPLLGRALWPAMVRKLFAPAETAPRFRDEYPVWMGLRPQQLRASSEEVVAMIPAAGRLARRYPELKIPVTIMAGAGDLHALPKLHSERLHRSLPQSELILVPEAGHMLHHTAPDKVMSALERLANTIAWQESGRDNVAVYPGQERQRRLH